MEIESNRKEYESLHPYKWLVLILTSLYRCKIGTYSVNLTSYR